jgi:LPS-assembly protein
MIYAQLTFRQYLDIFNLIDSDLYLNFQPYSRSEENQIGMVHPKLHKNRRRAGLRQRRFKRLLQILISKRGALLGCFILGVLANSHPAGAQALELKKERFLENNTRLPWVLEADALAYDQQLDQYVARGNVQIFKADKKLTADYVRYNHKTRHAFARGNVVLTVGQDILTGSQLDVDLENQVGWIKNAYLFLKENNFHITGDKIEKTGDKTYRIDSATFTTCDGPAPSWKISGKDVKIKADGSGTAKHTVLWAKKMPVLYSPYFYYPARKDRQTGFLMPEFGESGRQGYLYNQPFFWAISESADATFYANYMSNRGIKPGAEFRYILNERSQGALMLDGFKDQKTDEGGESSDLYGYDDAGEQVLRTNDNRFWFRMSHHQPIPLGFFAKLDLDIVSDQDYLRDFQDGHTGYEDSDEYFRKVFHRQLDDYNDPVRTNRLNLNRLWPKFSFNFEPRWNDDTRRDINTSETLQRLPYMSLNGEKQKILTSPFYFDLASQYDYFWRDSGTRGQRLDVHPRFYMPFGIKKYATVEPSIGLRETSYFLDKDNFEDQPDTEQWSHRELFDTHLTLFSEIERVFDLNGRLFERIKHRIRPQITHEYIPDSKQGDLPRFDTIDQIDKTNKITYALINTLTSKSKTIDAKKAEMHLSGKKDGEPQSGVDYVYDDFFRLEVANGYDFERSRRPFFPVAARLDFVPGKYIRTHADAQYSVYENEFLSHNIQATLWDNRGDTLHVNYRYEKSTEETQTEENIQSIFGEIKVQLTDSLSVSGENEYNFETDQRIRTAGGFTYTAQCWSFDFRYRDEPDDWKVSFKIALTGLGEIEY